MKRRLFLSALSLLLCCIMYIGTTFAWFTDSVESGNNIIASGSLDVEVYWSQDNVIWTGIEGDTTVFPQVLWEPGYTLVRYFKVVNEGNLALSYEFFLGSANAGILAEVIDVYYADALIVPTRETLPTLLTYAGGLDTVVNSTVYRDMLLPQEEAIYTVAFKMREEAGNEYMNAQLNDISIKVLATQAVHEKDSFDNLYDQDVSAASGDSIEALQKKYPFSYYASLTDAVNDIHSGTPGANASADKTGTVAGIYTDENNTVHLVLLDDVTVSSALKVSVDMSINLGGHALSSTTGTTLQVNSGNIYIDARIPGSEISSKVSGDATPKALAINKTATVTIDGGAISNEGVSKTSPAVLCLGTFNANNTTIVSKADNARSDGVSLSEGSTANIANCNISAYSENGKAYGVYVSKNCSVTITNSTVNGYANYMHNGSAYTSCSMGIYHSANSILTLNNCHVNGNIAGVQTYGTLYVNGGIYEGYGHGGFYFTGSSATSYIRNATIREAAMTEGYDSNNGTNHTGLYIGGGSNNTVYMDNCNIVSTGHAIVLRTTSGEKNNTLYISNSSISEGEQIRVDATTHKLYLGKGNSFTIDDVTLPGAVIETNETYIMN